MSAFVLDCSIALTWCFEDEAGPETDRLLDRVRDDVALVPTLWFWEVANALNTGVRRGRLGAGDVSTRLSLLATLPIAVDSDGPSRAWRETLLLAQAEKLTVYDAAYLELAIRRGADLATRDRQLASAAQRLGVRVIP